MCKCTFALEALYFSHFCPLLIAKSKNVTQVALLSILRHFLLNLETAQHSYLIRFEIEQR